MAKPEGKDQLGKDRLNKKTILGETTHCVIDIFLTKSAVKHKACKTVRGGADKFLGTETKLGIYSTYSPRSSIHFLPFALTFASHSQKFKICPFNQVSAAAITSASDEKW